MDNDIKVGVSNKEGQLGFVFTKGGHREGSGRKSIGVTKKVSLTLSDEVWAEIEKECTDHNRSRSEVIRNILESHYSNESN
ncbi:ribbon-helix-helix domain-containing protein [Paenibacillus glycanilyticus]|uniref:ribbon-helix-helix domain-containing protein n=1 Tax=Paenibacillus glycanilyticus TaxID=126569 RepID=UPI0020413BE3|nr:CopG family transcriptional regulator [Paenibacillus glycanilyticus]MCM3629762.1 ribbon-helix-helix domain-containing protein [Paenibacillus glycanilyticus]